MKNIVSRYLKVNAGICIHGVELAHLTFFRGGQRTRDAFNTFPNGVSKMIESIKHYGYPPAWLVYQDRTIRESILKIDSRIARQHLRNVPIEQTGG